MRKDRLQTARNANFAQLLHPPARWNNRDSSLPRVKNRAQPPAQGTVLCPKLIKVVRVVIFRLFASFYVIRPLFALFWDSGLNIGGLRQALHFYSRILPFATLKQAGLKW